MTTTQAPDDDDLGDPVDRTRGVDLASAGLPGYCACVAIGADGEEHLALLRYNLGAGCAHVQAVDHDLRGHAASRLGERVPRRRRQTDGGAVPGADAAVLRASATSCVRDRVVGARR